MPHRILYFHHAIGLGGAPNSLAYLIAGLDRSEFDPTVVMPKRPGNDTVKQLFLDAGALVIEERHIRPFGGVNGCRCAGWKNRGYAIGSAAPTYWTARRNVQELKPGLGSYQHLRPALCRCRITSGTGVRASHRSRQRNRPGKCVGALLGSTQSQIR